jgi:nucleotide-binding universal stress UspA family protein
MAASPSHSTSPEPQPDRPQRRTEVVAVAVEPDVPAEHTVRWAAREAARRQAHLHVVLPNDHRRERLPHDAFARTLAAARRTAPGVSISAAPDTAPLLRAELVASAESDLLVVAAEAGHLDELIRKAFCPVVVVPDAGPSAPTDFGVDAYAHPHDPTPVVLALGPSTADEVIAFGFTQASERHAGLLAVRTWHDPFTGLATFVPDRFARWDAADDAVRAELDQRLSAYRVAYPEVSVHTLVVEERCAELLAMLAHRARLVVLGAPARGRALNALSRSPALALAHNVPCPVAVVPVPAPILRSWLPTRLVGLSDLCT